VVEFARADGTPLLTQRSATLGTLADQPALFVAISDLRERRRLEAALLARGAAIEAAAEGSPSPIRTASSNTSTPPCSATAATPKKSSSASTRASSTAASTTRPSIEDLWQTIREGKVWRGEIVNRRKDGSLYTELMAIAPVGDEKGETSVSSPSSMTSPSASGWKPTSRRPTPCCSTSCRKSNACRRSCASRRCATG
jgi:PAS domain-containing protein